MLKSKYRNTRRRSIHGAIIAENAAVLYVLFFLIFFPLMDMAALSLRAFFFWYSCNQAAMAGAKATQWSTGSSTGISSGSSYYTSIQDQARNTLNNSVAMFTGIAVNGTPTLSVVLTAINHSDAGNNQATASTVTLSSGQLPLSSSSTPSVVDASQYVPMLRVTVNGTIQPFIKVPFMFAVPGLTTSFPVTINAEQQIENPAALSS